MKIFQTIQFRTFCLATEDEEKVEKALRFVAGDSPVNRIKTEGVHGNPILILEFEIKNKREIDAFWNKIKTKDLIPEILKELDKLIDDNCFLYLRFDKQKAFCEEFQLATHGDTIAMKSKIRVFPSRRDRAIESVRKFIETP